MPPSNASSYVLRWVLDRDTFDYELPKRGTVIVGRSADCDICISETGISRRHVAIHVDERLWVEDLGSANGTFLTGVDDTASEDEQVLTSPLQRRGLEPGNRVPLHESDVLHVGRASATLRRMADVPDDEPVVADPAMREAHELARKVADTPLSVLLLGETGVGKEVMAERIVRQSARADKPFLKLNCAAFQETLLESELFGHERGAFTGANKVKPGLLEAGNGGTVFLDEIGEIPHATQVKLLRVLEAGQVMRVGALSPRPIDVRFISATNRDLQEEAKSGSFREDLFFRLNGVSIFIPPLRARPAELEPLARRFVAAYCARTKLPLPELSADALAAMRAYTWRGNVRELKNVMERAAVLGGAVIRREHLPPEVAKLSVPSAVAEPPDKAGVRPTTEPHSERDRIIWALEECAGNQTRAARLLGMSRTTLSSRLDQYDIPRPRK